MAGHLGAKSGHGFYEYKNGKPVKSDNNSEPSDLDIITDRLILTMLNESASCLHEGVVQTANDLDIGMIFGTGFAPFRGGPLQYAKARGIDEVVKTLESLAKRFGQRFKPSEGWADVKAADEPKVAILKEEASPIQS